MIVVLDIFVANEKWLSVSRWTDNSQMYFPGLEYAIFLLIDALQHLQYPVYEPVYESLLNADWLTDHYVISRSKQYPICFSLMYTLN